MARSSGWRVAARDSSIAVHMLGRQHVHDDWKPDRTNCVWVIQVLNIAEGVHHMQIKYTPRDVRPSCL